MILLKEYSSVQEAYIAKGWLEDNGIASVVTEDALFSIYPTPGSGRVAARLYVEPEVAESASKLLCHPDLNSGS